MAWAVEILIEFIKVFVSLAFSALDEGGKMETDASDELILPSLPEISRVVDAILADLSDFWRDLRRDRLLQFRKVLLGYLELKYSVRLIDTLWNDKIAEEQTPNGTSAQLDPQATVSCPSIPVPTPCPCQLTLDLTPMST